MMSGGGTKLPAVLFGPATKRSPIALTHGKPVAAAKGFPGPELDTNSER